MKRVIIITSLLFLSACAGPCYNHESPEFATKRCEAKRITDRINDEIYDKYSRRNAYGSGIHSNQFGQPVTLQGGMPNSYIQRPNAYGPGIHMDQYGNAVR